MNTQAAQTVSSQGDLPLQTPADPAQTQATTTTTTATTPTADETLQRVMQSLNEPIGSVQTTQPTQSAQPVDQPVVQAQPEPTEPEPAQTQPLPGDPVVPEPVQPLSPQPDPQPQSPQGQPVQPQDLGAVASALPQAVADAAAVDPLNPLNATSQRAAKETGTPAATLENLAKEMPGAKSVEQERTPEISPEVESWLQSVENHKEKTPQNIVVADKTAENPTGVYAAEPVIVLPLTQTGVQQGMKHPIQDSVKWLAVWCIKVIKKFHGMVVYRAVPNQES